MIKIFSPLYTKTMKLSRHPQASWYLATLSFIESIFFPVPTDVMLAPMCLANPSKWWRFAINATVFSVLGGLVGYAIGFYSIDTIIPWLQDSHYYSSYQTAVQWFEKWGVWVVFIAGFSPIPFKVFTIAAGSLSMAAIPFTLAALIGRGCRFFLVAGLMAWGGERMEKALHKYIDALGWLVVMIILSFAAFKYLA